MSKDANFPRSIVVLGMRVKIKLTDELDEGKYGDYCIDTKVIRISKSISREDQIRTLFHEIGHATQARCGIYFGLSKEVTETWAESNANVMYELLEQLGVKIF